MKKGQRGEIMGITHSILIVIMLAILVCLLHKTNHPLLYPLLLIDGFAIFLISNLQKMKIANMENEGTILICGLFGICILDQILGRMDSKR